MKNLLNIFLFVVLGFQGFAQNNIFTINSENLKNNIDYTISLIKSEDNKLKLSIVNEQGVITTYDLDTIHSDKGILLALKDSKEKESILGQLNCSENELNKTFPPYYTGLITMINDMNKNNMNSIKVHIVPTEKKGFNFLWLLLLLPLLLLPFLFRKKNALKTESITSKEIQKNLSGSDDLMLKDIITTLVQNLKITEDDVKTYGLKESIVQKTNNLLENNKKQIDEKNIILNQLNNFKEQNSKTTNEQKTNYEYFKNIEIEYIKPILEYFNANNYTSKLEPQKIILENTLPMAFQFWSYINMQQNKSKASDTWNIQKILKKETDNNAVTNTTFDESIIDKTPMVAAIVGIMQNYSINELKDVNVSKYIIKK